MPYKDPEKRRAAARVRSARYRKRHPEKMDSAESRAKHRSASLRWYYKHRKTRLPQIRAYRAALRAEVLAAYAGKCVCCGESHHEFLAIDYVNNDGAAHRRKLGKKGYWFYLWLRKKKYPKRRYQLLCHNCNFAKGKYGGCPHKKK